LWDIASIVTTAVQQTAGEIVQSVKDTNWTSELEQFSGTANVDANTAGASVQHLLEQGHGLLEAGHSNVTEVLERMAQPGQSWLQVFLSQ